MIRRCENKRHKYWKHYGGRGIKVCRRWHRFDNFIADMGSRPDGYHIHRIDGDKNYTPGNCKWISPRDHYRSRKNNRWITFHGKTMLMYEWAHELGMNPITLLYRLKKGWTLEEALTIPTIKRPIGQLGRKKWIAIKEGRGEELKAESKRIQRLREQKYYREKKSAGICVNCPKPALGGFVYCREHRRKQRALRAKHNAIRKAKSSEARLNKMLESGYMDYCNDNGIVWKYHKYVSGRCKRCGARESVAV
jgi:hypothetical protein